MKKVNLVLIICTVVVVLLGVNYLGYTKEKGFTLTGKATLPPGNCHDPCSGYINDTFYIVDAGECGPLPPQFCPNVVEELEDCGIFVDNCTLCGCPSELECGADGGCILQSGDPDMETHTECVELPGEIFECVEFPGEGNDECSIDSDCYTTTHMVCDEDTGDCEIAPGPGRDQCDITGCFSDYLNRCDDYTWNNECQVANEPVYCLDGEFVNDCSLCGCPGDLICQESRECSLPKGNGDDFDSLLYLSSVSLELEKNEYIKKLVESNLRATLQFEKPEIPIVKFVRPTLTKISLNLPDKPNIEKADTTGEIQKSPELGRLILIRGLRSSVNGIQLSPGETQEEFRMLLGLKENKPYIGLQFPELP